MGQSRSIVQVVVREAGRGKRGAGSVRRVESRFTGCLLLCTEYASSGLAKQGGLSHRFVVDVGAEHRLKRSLCRLANLGDKELEEVPRVPSGTLTRNRIKTVHAAGSDCV